MIQLKKTDPERMGTVLYVLLEVIRHVGILLLPFMPETMDRLLDQLGVASDRRNFLCLSGPFNLVPGTVLPPPQGLFPRIVEVDFPVGIEINHAGK